MPTPSRNSAIGFIGSGVVGNSLAVALSRKGYRVVAAASRTYSSAEALASRVSGCEAFRSSQDLANVADVVFITTSDDAIESVASDISWRSGQAVIHTAGAASLDVLEPAVRQQGAFPGAFHPLQAFSSVEAGAESMGGITFGIEAGLEMKPFLKEMALALGGNPIFLKSEDKPLYHLTGVMMGNHLMALAGSDAQLWEKLGYTRADGAKALAPMMRQAATNLETVGLPKAVAGPYARGDIGTVRKHLDTLRSRAPEALPLYCELALAGLPFALEKGTLKPDRAEEIRKLVEEAKSETA